MVVFGRVGVLDGLRLFGRGRLDLRVGVLLPLGLAHDLLLVLLHDLQERIAHATSLRKVILHRLSLHLELSAVFLKICEDATAQTRLEQSIVTFGVFKSSGIIFEEACFIDFCIHLRVYWICGDAIEVVIVHRILIRILMQVGIAIIFGLKTEHLIP